MAPAEGGDSVGAAVGGLLRRWEQLALRATAPGPIGAASRGLGGSFGPGGLSVANGKLDVGVLAGVASWLPLDKDRFAARAASTAWRRASEHGPARRAWVDGLGGCLSSIDACDDSVVRRYAYLRATTGATVARILKMSTVAPKPAVLPCEGRLRGCVEPLTALADGTAVTLIDRAPVTSSIPDAALTVWDAATLTLLGNMPVSQLPHGQTIQRPFYVLSLRPSVGGCAAGSRQSIVLAMERLVAVFTWRLGGADGELQLREAVAEEVRWGEGGREALRSASFIGTGPLADVAVLLEGFRDGPIVEVYSRGASGSMTGVAPYSRRGTFNIAIPTGLKALSSGMLYGRIAVWGKVGDKAIEYAVIPEVQYGARPGEAGKADGENEAEKKAESRGGGASAAFAKARQGAKTVKLNVGEGDVGAGMDLEATRWGYLVEEVDEEPGQPNINAGDIIIAIAGHALSGLEDENALQWRFGRSIKHGVELTVIKGENAKLLLQIEAKAQAEAKAKGASEVPAEVQRPQEMKKKIETGRLEIQGKIEAWCVTPASHGAHPRLAAVADNHLYLANVCGGAAGEEAFCVASGRIVLPGVAKDPWKRPVTKIGVLKDSSDILVAGVTRGALLWRVPGLIATKLPTGTPLPAELKPTFLGAVPMPPRCNLVHLAFGFSLGVGDAELAWCTAELSGAGADSEGGLDVWRWPVGREHKDKVKLASAASSKAEAAAAARSGEPEDAVSEAMATVGAALDSINQAATAAGGFPDDEAGDKAKNAVMLRVWLDDLSNAHAEALFNAVDSAESSLTVVAKDMRRWLRQQQQDQEKVQKEQGLSGIVAAAAAAAERRADDARAILRCGEELRRRVVWPLQSAFADDESEGDDDAVAPAGGTQTADQGSAGGGGAESGQSVAAIRRQRFMQQRAAAARAAAVEAATSGGGGGGEASTSAEAFSLARRGR
eukprot:TRINITY_DN40526_c0_g1_i1.p1 TRINITY_DN40526_c0_g1~~TRINITY_DN40526_c0_g1_i1.p1  ORF type:complete len:984 (+),score=239.49 TRINITY_DN40526_c0_g1_i1:108-2954(+)